jgi:hypothetical protein
VLALRAVPDFQEFMGAVADELETLTKRIVMADNLTDAQLRTLQGQLRFGVSMLEAVDKAEADFEKYRQKEA